MSNNRTFAFAAAILAAVTVLTLAIYVRSLGNDFIQTWDDHVYIVSNDVIKSLSFENIITQFTSFYAANYHPLTTLSWAIEHAFIGLDPTFYHATNLVLHIINIGLVFYLILLITKKIPHAAIVALFFAVHPLNVEVVAFVSQRKDLLYTLFYFASLICYVQYRSPAADKRFMVLCFLFFLFSLLSKSMAVTLPVVMVLLDRYMGRAINYSDWLEKLPFFVLSLIFGIVAIYSQKAFGAIEAVADFSRLDHVFLVGYAVIFYVVKLLAPFHLSAMHGYPMKVNGLLPMYCYAAPLIIAIMVWVVWRTNRFRKVLAFGFLFFLITVAPVLQILPVGGALVSERYVYVPEVGIFFLLGYFFCHWYEKMNRRGTKPHFFAWVLVGSVAILFSFVSFQRTKVWADSFALWSDVIEKNPHVAVAYYNRGVANFNKAQFTAAVADYNKAIECHPTYLEAYLNRGEAKQNLSDFQGAIADHDTVIRLQPDHFNAYLKRARAKTALNDFDGAIKDLNMVISQKQDHISAYFQRADLHRRFNAYEEAKKDLDTVLEFDPANAVAYNNRGIIEAITGNPAAARKDFSRAVELKPGYEDALRNLKKVNEQFKKTESER